MFLHRLANIRILVVIVLVVNDLGHAINHSLIRIILNTRFAFIRTALTGGEQQDESASERTCESRLHSRTVAKAALSPFGARESLRLAIDARGATRQTVDRTARLIAQRNMP